MTDTADGAVAGMHPVERLGWQVAANAMAPDKRAELVDVLRGLVPALRDGGERRLLAHVLMCLSVHEVFRGEVAAARPLLDEALAVCDPDEHPTLYCSILQMEGTYWLHAAEPARALQVFAVMKSRAELVDKISLQIKAGLNLAYTSASLGDHTAAAELVEEASALADATRQDRRLGEVAAARLVVAVDARRFDDAHAARERFDGLVAEGRDIDGRAQALGRLFGAVLDVRAGDWAAAVAAVDALEDDVHMQIPTDRAVVEVVRASAALARGEPKAALAAVVAAKNHQQGALHAPRMAATVKLHSRVLRALGQHDASVAVLEEGLTRLVERDVARSAQALRQAVEGYLDEIHHLRTVELEATNASLRRLHASESEARAAAEAAASARSRFLSSMSHEIRTPLHGVLATLQLLGHTELSHAQAAHVDVLRRSADLTLRIIDDILDLGKLEAGRMSIEARPFSPRESVDAVAAMLAGAADEASVQLTIDVQDGVPEALLGDRRRFDQVLLNLIGNALKFAPRGRVVVRLAVVDRWLQLDVIDNGIGIPVDVQPTLFEPYTTSGSHEVRSSTGLGLAITKGIVDVWGGTISVASAPGEGATFTVRLPVRLAATSDAPNTTTAAPAPDLAGLSVLLVEDNAVNLELGRMLLEALGARVSLARDGIEAVSMVQSDEYDVILMDMHMPRMDGVQATRQLRSRGYTKPVVALTAAVLDDSRKEAIAAGMDGFATKPISQARLVDAILEVCGDRPT